MDIRNRINITGKTKQNVSVRASLAHFIAMPERDAEKIISNFESDIVFRKLLKAGVVKRSRPSNWKLASNFLEFDDGIFHNSDTGISKLIEMNKDLLPIIKKMTLDKFKAHFLDPDTVDDNIASQDLNLPFETVRRITSLVHDISVLTEFFHPSGISESSICYTKIANIENITSGFDIGFYSLNMYKGKYVIDKRLLNEFKNNSDSATKHRVNELLSEINMINNRKNTIHSIIETVVEQQKDFVLSGDYSKLKILSAKSVSEIINFSRSSISRAIYAKSIVLPDGKEVPLSTFFVSGKKLVKHILNCILDKHVDLTDEKLREVLKNNYRINASRRMICQCRNELTN